jgi:hypothetical protein
MPRKITKLAPVALTTKAAKTKSGKNKKGVIPPQLLPYILARRAGKKI